MVYALASRIRAALKRGLQDMLQPVRKHANTDHNYSMNPLEDTRTGLKRGAKAGENDNAGYFEVKKTGVLISPPGLLGWKSLTEPDTKFGPKFTANIHWTQAQAQAFALMIQTQVDILFPKLVEEVNKAKAGAGNKLKEFSADPWLEDKLKEPSEKNRIQLPFCHFATNASYMNRDKEVIPVTIKAWDAKNTVLDLPTLQLGMGSLVQIVSTMKLYTNGLLKGRVEPSLKLVGLRVLKLEQYGAGTGQLQELSEHDLVGVEEGFEVEDLSSFAMGAKKVDQQVGLQEEAGISGEDF